MNTRKHNYIGYSHFRFSPVFRPFLSWAKTWCSRNGNVTYPHHTFGCVDHSARAPSLEQPIGERYAQQDAHADQRAPSGPIEASHRVLGSDSSQITLRSRASSSIDISVSSFVLRSGGVPCREKSNRARRSRQRLGEHSEIYFPDTFGQKIILRSGAFASRCGVSTSLASRSRRRPAAPSGRPTSTSRDIRRRPMKRSWPCSMSCGRDGALDRSDGSVEGHAPEGSASAAASGLPERRPRDVEAAGWQREAETGRSSAMTRVTEQASDCESQDSDRVAGPTAARGRAGVEPGPSDSRTPGGSNTASPCRPTTVMGTDKAASASASRPSYLLAQVDPAAFKGASGDDRSHAPPATISFAGWSSPVARKAHNLEAVSSNLTPATSFRSAA